MAVISGATTGQVTAASADEPFLALTHTTFASTDLVLSLWGMEGNEEPDDPAARWAVGQSASAEMTLVRDTLSTGSNTDVRLLVHGLISPTVLASNTRIDWNFGAAPVCNIFLNISGVNTASVAAATEVVTETIIVDASTSATLVSGGTNGNDLLVFAVAQGADMGPPTVTGYTLVTQGSTAAGTSDFYYYVGHLPAGAPGGASVDWASSDESSAILLSLANSGGATSIVPLRRRRM